MKKYLLKITLTLAIICGITIQTALADPALPIPVKVKQADGTEITVILYGDEFFHYTTTTDGYTISQKNGIYYYCTIQADGSSAISRVKANDPGKRSAAERVAIASVSKADVGFMAEAINSAARDEWSQAEGLQKAAFPTKGNIRGIVLLVNFADVKFESAATAQQNFTNLLNMQGYSANGGTGSAKDYYVYNSKGAFQGEFNVFGPFDLPQPMEYYGENIDGKRGKDRNARQMIIDACTAAANTGLDFAPYDNDNDGFVDNVFVFYAGYAESNNGPAESIWPHKWKLAAPISMGAKQVSLYACASELKGNSGTEMTGIGTFCHEFGHVLGLKDVYDTAKATGKNTRGLYNWSLMSNGNHNNNGNTPPSLCAFERLQLNWIERREFSEAGEITLKNISENEAYFMNTSMENEYFTFEYRDNQKGPIWDRYGWNVPGGLMIMHIDESKRRIGNITAKGAWTRNKVNTDIDHMCARIITSSGLPSYESSKLTGAFLFPGSGNKTEFSYKSVPQAIDWNENFLERNLSNIRVDGDVLKFSVDNGGNTSSEIGTNDILISWGDVSATKWRIFYKKKTDSGFSPGQMVDKKEFLISGLAPATTYIIRIEKSSDGIEFEERSVQEITTKTITENAPGPLITMAYENKASQPIYLRCGNLRNGEQVTWFVNGIQQSSTIANLSVGDYRIECKSTINGKKYTTVRYIRVDY